MTSGLNQRISILFNGLGVEMPWVSGGLAVTSPATGDMVASLAVDDAASIAQKASIAREVQQLFSRLPRARRADCLRRFAEAIRRERMVLAELIMLEAGKTQKEALIEADGAADVMERTIQDCSLPDSANMIRCKERPALGCVALITSFNFPLVVAGWTLAPALLAGNAVLWKPSEKTPLTALAVLAIARQALGDFAELVDVVVGAREVGAALVSEPLIDMVSATGSVAMGRGIRALLAARSHPCSKPILELGGNNGVIISGHMTDSHSEWALDALLHSILGTGGQRCTNTRRLIVHISQLDNVCDGLMRRFESFVGSGAVANPLTGESNAYGYSPLIDADAYQRFELAKQSARHSGGRVLGGDRLMAEAFPEAFYVAPALAVVPAQSEAMLEETFAPFVWVCAYDGGIEEAVKLVNAPANAGLVAGIYTLSQREADYFAYHADAGHVLINSPKGTGTPAYGMGFGGNKDSGEGEILNSADPLRPFTRDTHFRRIAQCRDIPLVQD